MKRRSRSRLRSTRSDWIPIADSGWDDKPHFSANGKLIYFPSDGNGFRCIWAQPQGPDMHFAGEAFAVYHSHERRRSLRNLDIQAFELAVGPNMLIFSQEERAGNIWAPGARKSAIADAGRSFEDVGNGDSGRPPESPLAGHFGSRVSR